MRSAQESARERPYEKLYPPAKQRYPFLMRASALRLSSTGRVGRSAIWRGTLFLLPTCAVAWASGCSEDPAASPVGGDASPDVVQQPDAGGDAAPTKRDCTNDLNDDQIWNHLECSGLYSSFADKTVATDVKPYKPGVELWSDGAEKQRWISLPPGTKIDISDWNEWSYPKGTKLWKEFKLGGKRIETRMFMKRDDGSWAHTVYRWNADETDAVAKNGGEKIVGLGPDGGTYEIPNSGHCDQCHFGRKDQVLGFEAVNLGLPTATGETLAKLAAEDRLSATPPKTVLELPAGSAGDKSAAAVGWLHANCGACHNANTNAAASFVKIHFLVRADQLAPSDGGAPAKLEDLDVYAQGYCKDSNRTEPDAGVTKYKYLRGGDPSRSLVSILSGQRVAEGEEPNSAVQMPPMISRAVDHAGHKLVDDWIASLPPCP